MWSAPRVLAAAALVKPALAQSNKVLRIIHNVTGAQTLVTPSALQAVVHVGKGMLDLAELVFVACATTLFLAQ